MARLIDAGHRVISLVMTNSGYADAAGVEVRSSEQAAAEGSAAARVLGYELVALDNDTFDLPSGDSTVREILRVLGDRQIDTILTHWHGDTHPPHRALNGMVVHAGRRASRVLGFAVNSYLGTEAFDPRVLVPLEQSHWERKIEALRCYESELARTGGEWVERLDRVSRELGSMIGAPRAEAFVAYKLRWEP